MSPFSGDGRRSMDTSASKWPPSPLAKQGEGAAAASAGAGTVASASAVAVAAPAPEISGEELKRIPAEVLGLVPERMARRFCLIPVALENDTLTVATADPSDVVAIDTLIINTGCGVKTLRAAREDILAAIERHYSDFGEMQQDVQNLLDVER